MLTDKNSIVREFVIFKCSASPDSFLGWPDIFDNSQEIAFTDSHFCLAGKFGISRSIVSNAIKLLGGHCLNSVSTKLDYLVIGNSTGTYLEQVRFGSKIRKAILEQQRRCDSDRPGPTIISENKLVSEALKLIDHHN
jgi:hypothetical protein